MTATQAKDLAQSIKADSDALNAWIKDEVAGHVHYHFRGAYESFGYRYTTASVQSVADDCIAEIRLQLEGRHCPNESEIEMIIWKVSTTKSIKFIHSM